MLYVKERHMDNVVFIPYQDKADLIYSLNAGDVHWCVNAKGIKGVSCPSKAYGIMAAAKPILGVLESGSEVRCLIEIHMVVFAVSRVSMTRLRRISAGSLRTPEVMN